MRIRRAEIGDALAVATVHVRSWQAAFAGQVPQDHLDGLRPEDRREQWEDILASADWPRRGVLVAEDDGVLGFAALSPNRDGDADPAAVGEIAALYLSPGVWGRGIGGRLMTESLALFREAGFPLATLWVLDTNEPARRFYEACGWRADGTVKARSNWTTRSALR